MPPGVESEEAGALGADGITALRGLDDTLHLKKGERLMIFGASGGIGHIAVQLAKRMGAKVLAVASKPDGVALVRRLGADAAIDGHEATTSRRLSRAFAPEGLDAALVLAGGEGSAEALKAVRKGGRIALSERRRARAERAEGRSRARVRRHARAERSTASIG